MDFTLLGKTIAISDGTKNYMQIISDFSSIADRACREFTTKAANQWLEKYDDGLDYYIKQYVTETRKYLASYGVYTVSDQEIWDFLVSDEGSHSFLHNAYDKLSEDIMNEAPDLDGEELTNYLVINLVKWLDNHRLDGAVRVDIMGLCDYTANYLRKNSILEISLVDAASTEKAEAIYSNLSAGVVPLDKCAELSASLIELDPTETDYYRYIFSTFPAAKAEIAKIALHLHINLEDLFLDDLNQRFNPNLATTETAAIQMFADLQAAMAEYGVSKHKHAITLTDKINRFDIEARTYDNIMYATREQRAQAEADDQKLNEMCKSLSSLDKDLCQKLLEEIYSQNYVAAIAKKYSERVNAQIKELDIAYLDKLIAGLNTNDKPTCQLLIEQINSYECACDIKKRYIDKVNDRIDEIDQEHFNALTADLPAMDEASCNRLTAEISEYQASEALKTTYTDKIAKRVKEIWEAEDFVKYVDIYTATPMGDSTASYRSRAQIQQIGRTDLKEKFVLAVFSLNETEVTAAAKYIISKDGNALSALLNSGKKASYDILTVDGRVMHPAIEAAIAALREKKSGGILSSLMGKRNSSPIPPAPSATTVNGPKFCANCGSKLGPTAKFCPNCGNKIN